MNKPKSFIHTENRGGLALIIGRAAVPMDFLLAVVGTALAGSIVYGFVGLFTQSHRPTECSAFERNNTYDDGCLYFWDWSWFQTFHLMLLGVAVLLVLWGIVSLIAWGVRRFSEVNKGY